MRAAAIAVVCVAALAACTSSGNTSGPTATPPGTAAGTTPTGPSSHPVGPPKVRPSDWPMYHGFPDRRGVSTTMPHVSGPPKVVARIALDGNVYASPVVVGGITVVATEHDTVYAFDASYHQLWKRNLGEPSPASERPCGNIDPLGITGTPIVTNGTVYVAPELTGTHHRLVALDLHTGRVRWQRSIDLPGVERAAMQERGALAVSGGRVWVPFGGLLGDCGGYKGRVVGVRLDGSGTPLAFTVPTAREGGIWTPPGPSVDAEGNLFVSVGNGASGFGDPYDHSDSVLKLGTDAKLRDSFSPTTWRGDNENDRDLGSQGPALVGQWVFIAGKSGIAYVLRRDHLGGIGGEVSQAKVCTSFGGTAVVGSVVFVPCTAGVYAVRIDSAGSIHVLWRVSSIAIAGSPVVGGGRVWALDQEAGVLHGLDLQTGVSREQIGVGVTSRFATPALSGKDVLVPTLAGLTVVATS